MCALSPCGQRYDGTLRERGSGGSESKKHVSCKNQSIEYWTEVTSSPGLYGVWSVRAGLRNLSRDVEFHLLISFTSPPSFSTPILAQGLLMPTSDTSKTKSTPKTRKGPAHPPYCELLDVRASSPSIPVIG